MFECIHCHKNIATDPIGTKHRNHCPFCLWSKHLDLKKPGDRLANCGGEMKPLKFSFKASQELLIVHQCQICQKISQNRIAGDDSESELVKLIKQSDFDASQQKAALTQLFGNNYSGNPLNNIPDLG